MGYTKSCAETVPARVNMTKLQSPTACERHELFFTVPLVNGNFRYSSVPWPEDIHPPTPRLSS